MKKKYILCIELKIFRNDSICRTALQGVIPYCEGDSHFTTVCIKFLYKLNA